MTGVVDTVFTAGCCSGAGVTKLLIGGISGWRPFRFWSFADTDFWLSDNLGDFARLTNASETGVRCGAFPIVDDTGGWVTFVGVGEAIGWPFLHVMAVLMSCYLLHYYSCIGSWPLPV